MSAAGGFPVRTEIVDERDNESDENGDFFRSVIRTRETVRESGNINIRCTTWTSRGRENDTHILIFSKLLLSR